MTLPLAGSSARLATRPAAGARGKEKEGEKRLRHLEQSMRQDWIFAIFSAVTH
jgi:hypothetical protein